MKPAGMLKSSAAAPAFQPLYRQIKHLITQSLVSGEWRPGDPIPSEIELASRYSVSQGTFVASHAEERSKFHFLRLTPDRGELKAVSAQLIDFRRLRADAVSAKLLRLPRGGGLCLI